ncbi:hypothetical protein [Methanocaldococcus sp.]
MDKIENLETTITVFKKDKDLFDFLYIVYGIKKCKSKKEFFGYLIKEYIKLSGIKSVRIEFDVEFKKEE